MKVADKTLLTTQSDDVFRELSSAGFNPAEFELNRVDSSSQWPSGYGAKVSILFHKASRNYFKFDRQSADRWISRHKPGYQQKIDNVKAMGWGEQFTRFKAWLGFLRRELDAPDLWAKIAESGIDELQIADPDSYFTAEEIEQLKTRIDLLQTQLIEEYELQDHQIHLIRDELDQVKDQLKNLNRRMWVNLLLGSLLKIVFIIDPMREKIGDIIGKGISLLSDFIASGLTLPPSQ